MPLRKRGGILICCCIPVGQSTYSFVLNFFFKVVAHTKIKFGIQIYPNNFKQKMPLGLKKIPFFFLAVSVHFLQMGSTH